MKEIKSTDIMHIGFLKKEVFSGSSEGMRYRIEKADTEDGTRLRLTVWPEPFSFECTPDSEKTSQTFAFSEEGLEEGRQWLNRQKEQDYPARRLPFRS